MSFVRVGRPQQHTKGKKPVRSKKATAPKKEWVSTVNDLSVHKLTSAEQSHRHEIHKSHNKAAAQWELREKALKSRLRHIGSPAPLDKASLSIIREVFSDQLLLQDVLTRSDRALAVVKDLFGDAPRRQMGHPSVTMAPNCDPGTGLPGFQRDDPSTPLSILSQSTVDQQEHGMGMSSSKIANKCLTGRNSEQTKMQTVSSLALNELEPSDEEYSLEDASPTLSANYYVKRVNVQKMNAQSRGVLKQRQKSEHRPAFDQADRDYDPVTPCASGRAPDPSALNATAAIKGVQSRQSQSGEGNKDASVLISQVLNPGLPLNKSDGIRSRTSGATRKCVSQTSELNGSSVASPSGDHSSLGLLQAMLGQVEADLDTLNPDTEAASAPGQTENRKQGLIGFSVALVSTLGRLVHLFKQKEKEAHTEAQERRRLEEELREQRGLVDALSVETMALREEVTVLQTRLQQQSTEFEQKLDTVVLVIGELGLLDAHSDPHQGSDLAAVRQSAPAAERDPPQREASVSPAVLLSPPQQRDNWQQMPGAYSVLQHQEHSMNTLQPSNGMQAHNSVSSLTSLPLCTPPSTSSLSLTSDPLSQLLSPDAMLAEIAQLSRQNELIKAQLSQAKDLRSVCKGSSDGVSGQRRSSSSNTGRVAPQSVGERRVSDTRSTGSKSQRVQAAEGEQLTRQETTQSSILPVSIVEQRLLELNKQSAAARGRLLQLIEQQKQNISATLSPSGSPIPPSAFSPHPADGGGSPEASVLLPEKDLLLQTSGYDRRYGGSSHNLGGERWDGKAQTEKRKEREGWFALSAHMR